MEVVMVLESSALYLQPQVQSLMVHDPEVMLYKSPLESYQCCWKILIFHYRHTHKNLRKSKKCQGWLQTVRPSKLPMKVDYQPQL